MTTYGSLIVDGKIIRVTSASAEGPDLTFRDKLEKCLLEVCRQLEIPVPLWLKKNTVEFARFRKTFFSNEQFLEKVWFDKFEFRLSGN